MTVQCVPRVAILDADRLPRETLARALTTEGVEVLVAAASLEELLASFERAVPEVALVSVAAEHQPHLLRTLRAHQPPIAALVLGSGLEAGRAERSFRDGAAGFVSRHSTGIDELLGAIHAAARGELHFPWGSTQPPEPSGPASAVGWKLQRLTPREREVLAHVAAGHDNLKIAALLNISERTVKSHVISVYRKLDAENRVQLALLAGQLGVSPALS